MSNAFFALLLLMASPQSGTFKKEMGPLQAAVDGLVASTGSQVLQKSMAAYLDGYGIVVTLEVAFETPQNPFSGYKTAAEVRTLVAQHRKDVREKITAFLTQRVGMTESLASAESLTIIMHVLNTNPADVPNSPIQILMTVKKDSPQPVAFKELF